MISSTSFSNRRLAAFFLAAVLLCLSACAGSNAMKTGPLPFGPPVSVAVFPVENLSGTTVPLKAIRELFVEELKRKGFHVLGQETLETFMVRNRVRYTGGIDETTAKALKKETGVDGVLIASVELYSEALPPKIALTARLVSTGETPTIVWVDGIGFAGDDAPGILDLGLIEDPKVLLKKGLGTLVASLQRCYTEKTQGPAVEKVKKTFQPKITYRTLALQPGKKYTIAVVPFFNLSERKNAGDVLVLQFMKHLHQFTEFQVVESGLVRNAFLTLRIIMQEGVSLTDADLLSSMLDVDLILAGTVFDYEDYQGSYGRTKVNFSAQLIEKQSKKIVWSSTSWNQGDDDVYFFELGRINTAHAMAAEMVRSVTNGVVKK
jgi:TolB-like protein